MPRGRMINKQISRSEKVSELPVEGQLLYTWMIPHTDVEGRLEGDIWSVKALVPYVDQITPQNIPSLLKKMEEAGLVVYYGNKHKYIQIKDFDAYQTLRKDQEAPSVIPSESDFRDRNGAETEQKRSKHRIKVKEKDKLKDKEKDILSGRTQEIVADLNQVIGTSFRTTSEKTRSLIKARMAEGFAVEDFKVVHRKKADEWQYDNKMVKFLRPETLYSNKFEGYLNQKTVRTLTKAQQVTIESHKRWQKRMEDEEQGSVPKGNGVATSDLPR